MICAKSEWAPAIRREHAWAQLAAAHGHRVAFIERPRDVRAIRVDGARSFVSGLASRAHATPRPGLEVHARTPPVPGHRSRPSAYLNTVGLSRALRRVSSGEASVVVNTPWDWRSARHGPARRRIFDLTDDWARLAPGREERFARYFAEISQEADEIIVVNPELMPTFPGRTPILVRNGASDEALALARSAPEPASIVYVGTFSERFDAPLMEKTLELLPDWRLDLIGPCLYGGLGAEPAPELVRLLRRTRQVTWHGALPRPEALRWVDRAEVAVIPNRPEHSAGQDSMKFYDYAARGRPMVSTRWFSDDTVEVPPLLLLATTPDEMVTSIRTAATQSDADGDQRRAWAAERTWAHRWESWSTAVFGGAGEAAS